MVVREGVTQGDPIFVLLYVITLSPLAEDLRTEDLGLISPFYVDDVAFNGSERSSAYILKLLMERTLDRGYFPKPYKSIFIYKSPEQ